MNDDTRTLAVIQNKRLLVEGREIVIEGEFDCDNPERFIISVDGEVLGGVLQSVLSFVRDSADGKNFVPYLEVARQARPTSGTQERSMVSFSKIKRFSFRVEVTT